MSENGNNAGQSGPATEDLYCLDCGYRLCGLPGEAPTCPECGKRNPLDDRAVDRALVLKMRRRLDKSLQRSDLCLVMICLLLLPGFYGFWSCVGLVVIPFAIWAVCYVETVGVEGSGASKIARWVLLSQAVAIGAVALACGLSFAVWHMNRQLGWWQFGVEHGAWHAPVLLGVLIALIIGVIPFRWCRRRVRPHLDWRAEQMARHWHRNWLRTPPERRSWWSRKW